MTIDAAPVTSLADPAQLQQLYQQACAELDALDPEVAALEAQLSELQQRYQVLKQNRQRLLTIKLSLQGLVQQEADETAGNKAVEIFSPVLSASVGPRADNPNFSADVAFYEVNQRLRQRDSVNYEIYRAIVYQGGRASTEQIRQYLIEQGIKQPATGEDFTQVSLADISARVNYLVKKGLVIIENRGHFKAVFGWITHK